MRLSGERDDGGRGGGFARSGGCRAVGGGVPGPSPTAPGPDRPPSRPSPVAGPHRSQHGSHGHLGPGVAGKPIRVARIPAGRGRPPGRSRPCARESWPPPGPERAAPHNPYSTMTRRWAPTRRTRFRAPGASRRAGLQHDPEGVDPPWICRVRQRSAIRASASSSTAHRPASHGVGLRGALASHAITSSHSQRHARNDLVPVLVRGREGSESPGPAGPRGVFGVRFG